MLPLVIEMHTEPHLEQFTECVREGRRPIGMFLGAGCAKSLSNSDGDPLIPDTVGMTNKIRKEVRANGMSEAWDKVIEDIQDSEDKKPLNIEQVLSQVRGLRRYANHRNGGPLSKGDLEKLENDICENIIRLVDVALPNEESGYLDLATWLGSVDRKEPVEIFTTNYDLLIEQALEKRGIPYFDGFVGGHKPFFDRHSVSNGDLPSQWVRLWKIHGSMNWISKEENGSIRIWRTDNIDDKRAVIHPSHLKYNESRKMPYLTLIDRLKHFLKRDESVLFIVGYSFGDEHLNDVIIQALREEPSSAVFAFKYGELDESESVVQMAKRQSNFSLFAKDAGIIGTEVQEWMTKKANSEPDNNLTGMSWERMNREDWAERFLLGDFQEFGKFLRSVTGSSTR